MRISEMTTNQRWRHALKPASWPKLLVPMALGQALGIYAAGALSPIAYALGAVFTLGLGVFIVLMNDWGDQEVDRLKREMFPQGCSPKTIPDAILPGAHVFWGGILGALAAVAAVLVAKYGLGRPLAMVGGLGCLGLFVAYTLPPLRLNYRGHGEWLEALGVGFALPWLQFYLQTGEWMHPALLMLAPYTILSMTSAIASGLADEDSDRAGGKRTYTTMFGNALVRSVIQDLLALGIFAHAAVALHHSDKIVVLGLMGAAAITLRHAITVSRLSTSAQTNAFDHLRAYKGALHKAIWNAGIWLSAALLLAAWLS